MTIFSEAQALAALPPAERLARAWRMLSAIDAADEFAAAINFAAERELVDPEFAPHLLGDASAKVPSRYWVNPIDGSEMVWIPSGPFLVGVNQHRAEARGFFLARYPVTNAQFAYCLTSLIAENSGTAAYLLNERDKVTTTPAEARHPVTHVSYIDAIFYCRWAGLTLPTEWLWEKAARGTDARTYPWGERQPYSIQGSRGGLITTGRLAQIREAGTCSVDQFVAVRSPYGCEQLAGNVSEWCVPDDGLCLSTDIVFVPQLVATMQNDPEQAAVRGSCFKRRSLSRMASSHRRRLAVTRRNDWVGFRPAFYPPAYRVVRG